jgi:hypothetical protein
VSIYLSPQEKQVQQSVSGDLPQQTMQFLYRQNELEFLKALSNHVFQFGTTIAYRLMGATKLPEIWN